MDGELYHFEESQYCLKIENFDVYSKLVKHQDSPSSLMMTLHAQLNPKWYNFNQITTYLIMLSWKSQTDTSINITMKIFRTAFACIMQHDSWPMNFPPTYTFIKYIIKIFRRSHFANWADLNGEWVDLHETLASS